MTNAQVLFAQTAQSEEMLSFCRRSSHHMWTVPCSLDIGSPRLSHLATA